MKTYGIPVTHISTVHPLSDVRIFHKECKSLAKHGFQVNLVITHDREESIEGVYIIPLPKSKNRLTRMFLKPFIALNKALKTRAKIYHFHDPELIPIGIILKMLGKKVIYDVHEDVPGQVLDKHWIPPGLRHSISIVIKSIESISSRLFDGIVCATPYITEIFLKRNPNSLNINNYPLLEEMKYLSQQKTKSKEKALCYVGSLSKERGIFEIVRAIEGTDITFYLAGSPTSPSFLDQLKKEKGWKNVKYFGQVDRRKIYEIFSKSQAGILLFHPIQNHMNCIPNKLFEYMLANLPIIASNIPFWQSFFRNQDNVIFVDPLKEAELHNTLTSLFKSHENPHILGKNGTKFIKELFNWTQEEKKLIGFYQTLCDS